MKKADKIIIGCLILIILIVSIGLVIVSDETEEVIEKPIEQVNENKQTNNQEVIITVPVQDYNDYKEDNYNIKIIKIENKNNRNNRNKNKNRK